MKFAAGRVRARWCHCGGLHRRLFIAGTQPISYQWQFSSGQPARANSALILTTSARPRPGAYRRWRAIPTARGELARHAHRHRAGCAAGAAAADHRTQSAGVTVVAGQARAVRPYCVNGSGPFAYQWLKNGAEPMPAPPAPPGLAATSTADAGDDSSVRVSNSAGSVTNDVATLAVAACTTAGAGAACDQHAPAGLACCRRRRDLHRWPAAAGRWASVASQAAATSPARTRRCCTCHRSPRWMRVQYAVEVRNAAGSVISPAATLL